jgi:hypothetical protein
MNLLNFSALPEQALWRGFAKGMGANLLLNQGLHFNRTARSPINLVTPDRQQGISQDWQKIGIDLQTVINKAPSIFKSP